MDPSRVDESLQKTSPQHDPAAIYHLSSELSAQATQPATHHHQLQKLTTLMEEQVKTLQTMHVSPLELLVPPTSATIVVTAAQTSSVNPCLAFPEKYGSNPA